MLEQETASPSALERNLIERVCVGDVLARSADLHPDRVAIVDGPRRLRYADFDRQVDRLGHALLGLGLARQDVVAVMARNSTELLLSYFACARAGLVCAPVNLGLRPAEIAWCLRDAGARVLIVEAALSDTARSVLAEAIPSLAHRFHTGDEFDALIASASPEPLEVEIGDRDAVQILYTSGTTSTPKGVLTSHLAVTMAGLSGALPLHGGPGYTALVALPLFHCAMLNGTVLPLMILGGTLVLTQGFEPRQAATLIESEGVHLMVLLPMMYGLLLADPALRRRSFPTMRRAMYAMAPMPHERLADIHAMFPNADVVLASGQTEFTPATCMQRPEHQWSKSATWGTATAMTRVAVMDEHGRLLPRGQSGELVYRGPQVMNGYLNMPDESLACLRHGWFHSGDVARIDEDGAIWFEDRFKDVIKTGGENVASVEVERCLMAHPEVAEAAVVGLPHPHWGEAITGVVVRRPGSELDEATLMAHCGARLAGFKAPKAIVFVAEFPRTGTGKLQKHLIRDQHKDCYQP
ncbi:class I adenylate-forming enzyme family protein [Variovorax saccharolyticus]|uniref:class I adenylate-forming enzyme family protein n=1 Tax=Variovorax saccharolyticus TaxID=3053516 RepID=UPI002579066A|nr:AMP-binding protein [Variovorax sp. J22R187]MDM0020058.1 AMP-binding protein [Variovorax sp. J22R187]